MQKIQFNQNFIEKNSVNDNHNMTYHDIKIINHNMKHNMLPVQEYKKILDSLDKWGVFAAKKLIKQYVEQNKADKIKEAYSRTLYAIEQKKVKNEGAYFRKILGSL